MYILDFLRSNPDAVDRTKTDSHFQISELVWFECQMIYLRSSAR